MSNNDSKLWDKKYKGSRNYENVEDFFKFSKINPSVIAIVPFIKDGVKILEIGSGTGELISYIDYTHPNSTTYGLDYSEESVSRSSSIASQFGIKTKFIQGDIKKMPFPDEYFDIVFGDQVIGHIDYPEEAVREINRIIKKGGIGAFTIGNKLRPDGWYLYTKLSKKHEGYKQINMFPWGIAGLLKKGGLKKVSYYGELLFLFRNIPLLKSYFKKNNTVGGANDKVSRLSSFGVVNSKEQKVSFVKKVYRFLNKIFPAWAKVTVGVLVKK